MGSYCVYKHTTPSGKVYIGITSKRPETRWNKGLGYGHNIHFVNAIKRFGWDNIKHEVLATGLEQEEAFAEERRLIAEHKANDPKFGYNQSEGGESGFIGVSHSAEAKEKNRDAHRGRKASDETRKKMSEAHKAHPNSGCYQKGRIVPQEEREKSAKSRIGVRGKCVVQYTQDGQIVKVYSSVREAEMETNISDSNIIACCRGRRRTTCGYIWRYSEE